MVRHRKIIFLVMTLLLVPSYFGMVNTKVNYDTMEYLPQDLDSTKGAKVLDEDFHNAATSMLVLKDQSTYEVEQIRQEILAIPGVSDVTSRESIISPTVPKNFLPERLQDAFYSGDSEMLVVEFDGVAASEETMEAVDQIYKIIEGKGELAGSAPLVKDTSDLFDHETAIYALIGVVLAIVVLSLFSRSTFIPLFFIINIGYAILYNMGTNIIFGEISYITQALAAVLQLAVTMDYSIFLYDRFEEEKIRSDSSEEAMGVAINETLSSITGSALTTIAGFLALTVMQLTFGRDIGLVMAKGVLIGLLTTVTLLPALILIFEHLIERFHHRIFLPNFGKAAGMISKHNLAFLILALVMIGPAVYGAHHYDQYYDLAKSLPESLPSSQATKTLVDDFDIQTTDFVLAPEETDDRDLYQFQQKLGKMDGIEATVSDMSVRGPLLPERFIPNKLTDSFVKGGWHAIMVQSSYTVATPESNDQIIAIRQLMDDYLPKESMLTGEASMTNDMVAVADQDFDRVNTVSIIFVFAILFFLTRSISLPIILILSIELAIQINMAIPFFTGTEIPFIASIVIGTIQLGATIDYSILITDRWMTAIRSGAGREEAVRTAVKGGGASVFTSASTFLAATLGVGLYSDMDLVSVICNMLARGAILSMLVIIFLLPSFLYFLTPLVVKTTKSLRGFRDKDWSQERPEADQ